MTNIQHPITPPPELMQRWREQAPRYRDGGVGREDWLMARAAQWGADHPLGAQGPTDEDLDAAWFASGSGVDGCEWRAFARTVLARWGRPAVEPTDD